MNFFTKKGKSLEPKRILLKLKKQLMNNYPAMAEQIKQLQLQNPTMGIWELVKRLLKLK